jgi:nucleotide-binding universal stress UspA family protein
MKVLLAVDRSPCSDLAVQEMVHHAWPPGTEIEVVSVAHTRIPMIPEPTLFMVALHESALDEAREEAEAQVKDVQAQLVWRLSDSHVTTTLLEGSPAQRIVEEARRWHADLIVVGSHRRTGLDRLLHPSVSRAVLRHAPCPVDVVGRTD